MNGLFFFLVIVWQIKELFPSCNCIIIKKQQISLKICIHLNKRRYIKVLLSFPKAFRSSSTGGNLKPPDWYRLDDTDAAVAANEESL